MEGLAMARRRLVEFNILKVEAMSDGHEVSIDAALVDDFTQEAIERPLAGPHTVPPTSAAELGRQKQIKRQDAQRQVLKVLDEVRSPRPKALFIRRV